MDVSIPAGRAVFPGFRSVGRFQPGASFSVRRQARYSCSVIAVLCHCIQHNSIPNCPECQPFAAQNREIQGQLFYYIAKLLCFSEQAHSWPEIQIDNVNQIRLSNEHRSIDSYPVSDLVLRDINKEIRITLSDLEYLFIRKGELSAGKEHTVRNCDTEVF